MYPEGASLEAPEQLGQALRAFLKTQSFSTRDLVIGLPAKRLVTRRKEVPPAPPATAANLLRLQAEGEFSAEPDALMMDYAGETSDAAASTVLLIAATRACIDQCTVMAKNAGLKLQGVTSTGAALGLATSRVPGGDGVVVSLAPGGSELVVQHGSSASQIRHLNVGDSAAAESMGMLVGEIRRTVAGLSRNGSPLTLAVWTGGTTGSILEQRLNMPVTSPGLRTIVTTTENDADRFAPAVAIALAALDADRLPVDFLDSRLAPPEEAGNSKLIKWGITAGVIVLAAVGYAYNDYQTKQADLDKAQATLKSEKADIDTAKTAKDRLEAARKWASGKPNYTTCLRDITRLFPEDTSIYVTGLTLHPKDPMTGEIIGKASNANQVLRFLDTLNQPTSPFKGAKSPDTSAASKTVGNEVTFTITFTYNPAEATTRGSK